eukprot:GEMP01053701.1.p1 GENE.GEMP01053701.1~~GEMP01053701.1.p1  ORF type:complete len:394 (+),score=105.77 GEMP01053701.1:29-1210(+)
MLQLRGVPFKAKAEDIAQFLNPACEEKVDASRILIGKKRRAKTLTYAVPKVGEAWIPMRKELATKVRERLNRSNLMDRYIDVDFLDINPTDTEPTKSSSSEPAQKKRKTENATEEREVFVRFLPFEVDEQGVREFFDKVGALSRVKLIGTSGIGFVTYESRDDAKKAIDEFNGAPFKSRTLKVCWGSERQSVKKAEPIPAPPSLKLFVQGLPFDAEEDQIASFVTLETGYRPNVYLVVDKVRPNQRLGKAIVEFAVIEDATEACETLKGKMMGGRKIRAAPCREKESPKADKATTTTTDAAPTCEEVFLKWLPHDADEACIRKFVQKRLPKDAQISNIKMLRDKEQYFKGVAFLSLENVSAQTAAECIDGAELRGRSIEASVALAKKKTQPTR